MGKAIRRILVVFGGFIKMEENKTWTAHLHRNTRTGKGWTETKKGFASADKARRWIELEAED